MLSLIIPVLNEADNIHLLLDSICQQTRMPDEVIILDGGSTDGTWEILNSYKNRIPLKLIQWKGCNTSQSRNRMIEIARGDIILATDAGQFLSHNWIEALSAPLLNNPQLQVVGGFFVADCHSTFEIAMGALVTRLQTEINPQTFLPGSRCIAFRKAAWLSVDGYPEWLDYGEDMLFILKLRQRYPNGIGFAPQSIVYFRPRTSVGAFFKQYFNYATGDGKANLWRKRHLIRYATYLLLIPLIFVMGIYIHPLHWLWYLIGGAVYLYHPYRRLFTTIVSTQWRIKIVTVLLVPALRITGDTAKMFGYPVGWCYRKKRTTLKTKSAAG